MRGPESRDQITIVEEKLSRNPGTSSRGPWLTKEQAALVAVWGIFIGLRTFAFTAATVREFPDSASFLDRAKASVLDPEFFFGEGRLFSIPLFYKTVSALGFSSRAGLTVAQFVASLAAWTALAIVFVSRLSRPWLRCSAFAATLVFGMTADVTQWDRVILAESISITLFALQIACIIWFGIRPSFKSTASLIIVSLLWSFARESNSFLVLAFGLILPLWGARYHGLRSLEFKLCASVATICLGGFLLAQSTAERGERWFFPLLNVVGKRILPSPGRTSFFAANGMPITPTLMSMSGEFASGKDWAFYNSPDLAQFRSWLRENGREVYGLDLLTHPLRTIHEPIVDIQRFICPDLAVYQPAGFIDLLAHMNVGGADFCGTQAAIALLWLSLIAGFTLLPTMLFCRKRLSSSDAYRGLTVAVLLAMWCPLTWLTWHAIGDMEIGRHVLWATLIFRMGLLLSAGFILDSLVRRGGSRSQKLPRWTARSRSGLRSTAKENVAC